MSVNMTAQTIAVGDNWTKVGNDYIGDSPNGSTSGGTAALAWSAPSGLADGNTLTITTDGTYSFGAKASAKPLFYWKADIGSQADLTIGRTDWRTPEADSFSTEQVAPNSVRSFKATHDSNSGAALGWVDFTTRDVTVFRRIYENLNVLTDYGMRTRVTTNTGDPNTITEGMTVTGGTSGATGVIWYYDDGATNDALRYLNTGGTINDPTPTDFVNGELLTVSNGVTLNCVENLFRTSNFKTIRLWSDGIENSYFTAVEYRSKYAINHENTASGTAYPNTVTQTPDEWLPQLFQLRNSSVASAADAFFSMRQKDIVAREDNFISYETDSQLQSIAQSQVSNGMAKGAATYWDTLYVDDTLMCVVIGDAATWAACTDFEPQPTTTWTASSINITLSQGVASQFSGSYIYVLDVDGTPITVNGVQI